MSQAPLTVREGYARWSRTYDYENNPLIRLEERAVAKLITQTPQRVLDAACGTGRHALRFALDGARVVGVDATGEMVALAAAKARAQGLEGVRFIRGMVGRDLPVGRARVDLAVCALALCHVLDVHPAIASLCRTVWPGGQVLITDLHPAAVAAGLETLFSADGVDYSIKTAKHSKEHYLHALEAAGARLVEVQEIALGEACEREPHGLPAGVYKVGWKTLPFCLVLLAQMPDF